MEKSLKVSFHGGDITEVLPLQLAFSSLKRLQRRFGCRKVRFYGGGLTVQSLESAKQLANGEILRERIYMRYSPHFRRALRRIGSLVRSMVSLFGSDRACADAFVCRKRQYRPDRGGIDTISLFFRSGRI